MRTGQGGLLSGLAVILLASTGNVDAADRGTHDWNNLRGLRVGQPAEVVRMDMTGVRGRFEALDDSAITVRTDHGDVIIPRGDVFRVISRQKARRLRNVLIGASIVGGAALVAGAAARAHGDPETEGIVAPLTLIGAGIGAAIGVGRASYPTVYVAEKRIQQ